MAFGEIPYQIIAITVFILMLSLFVSSKLFRNALKIGLMILSMVALRLLFPKLVSTECAVSFVFILAALKAWELESERDHFNMFLILALSECGLFLINPSAIVFVLGLIKMVFYFYFILKIRNYNASLLSIKRVIILITPALLFSLLLFYTFPRFTQGFINTNEMQTAYFGTSSQFDFASLPPLNPTGETVFKVYGLEDAKINPELVYWRSHVLWDNRNQEWRGGYNNLKGKEPEVISDNSFNYTVELQLKIKEFLPTLDGESNVSSPLPFNFYHDGSRRLKVLSRSDLTYQVKGNYGSRQRFINDLMLRKGLRLNSNAESDVRKKFFPDLDVSLSDDKKLQLLIKSFRNNNFQYNISPPAYKSVEEFILTGKDGYCTHFAAAMAYLGRAMGLPTRIIIGYLGGERNPYDGSVLVREMDAHAWTEFYLKEEGWVRVDPTSLVAPARLEMNSRDFYAQLNPYLEIFNIKISRDWFDGRGLRNASLFLDSLNSKLASNVFNLDREEQAAILRKLKLANNINGWPFVVSLVVFLFISYLYISLWVPQSLSRHEKRYLRFLRKMQRLGIVKENTETATQFQLRCVEAYPNKRALIDRETDIYINKFYR